MNLAFVKLEVFPHFCLRSERGRPGNHPVSSVATTPLGSERLKTVNQHVRGKFQIISYNGLALYERSVRESEASFAACGSPLPQLSVVVGKCRGNLERLELS